MTIKTLTKIPHYVRNDSISQKPSKPKNHPNFKPQTHPTPQNLIPTLFSLTKQP